MKCFSYFKYFTRNSTCNERVRAHYLQWRHAFGASWAASLDGIAYDPCIQITLNFFGTGWLDWKLSKVNSSASETMHFWPCVVKTKIGLRTGSFIWRIFILPKSWKKYKVSVKERNSYLPQVSLEPGTFSTAV